MVSTAECGEPGIFPHEFFLPEWVRWHDCGGGVVGGGRGRVVYAATSGGAAAAGLAIDHRSSRSLWVLKETFT